jgi:hypothetical protein
MPKAVEISYSLPVDVGRRTGIPRTRVPPWCRLQEVGDKRHLIFTGPALDHIRIQYRSSPHDLMVQFLWLDDLVSVAQFMLRLYTACNPPQCGVNAG